MTVAQYFKHYISMPDVAIFFGLALGMVILVNIILFLLSYCGAGKHAASEVNKDDSKDYDYEKSNFVYHKYQSLSQKFYEIVFSGNCILFFMAVYYLINRFYSVEPYKSIFNKYSSFLLLVLIIISCILNTFLDRVFVRLNHVEAEDRAAIKILGMLYMLIIFAYIKYIDNNNNYDMYITYFLGIMIGRFVYFDSSLSESIKNIGRALSNIPVMLLALGCTAVLSIYGLKTEYLIRHIGVVTNIFIAHIFLCVAIFIIFHIHPERWFRPKRYPRD